MVVINASIRSTTFTSLLGFSLLGSLSAESLSSSPRDLCYYQLASSLSNSSICSSISNASYESMCNSSISSHATANTTNLYNTTAAINTCANFTGSAYDSCTFKVAGVCAREGVREGACQHPCSVL